MPATIVIVDDNPDLLDLWETALSNLLPDFRFLLAETVAQALQHLDRQTVDLMVTDMEMPEQSGLDLIRIMKVKSPQTPILVVTGSTQGRSIKEAMELEISACLEKPLFPDELANAITLLLKKEHPNQLQEESAESHTMATPAKTGSFSSTTSATSQVCAEVAHTKGHSYADKPEQEER